MLSRIGSDQKGEENSGSLLLECSVLIHLKAAISGRFNGAYVCF